MLIGYSMIVYAYIPLPYRFPPSLMFRINFKASNKLVEAISLHQCITRGKEGFLQEDNKITQITPLRINPIETTTSKHKDVEDSKNNKSRVYI
jgi:hypothetical protein